MRYAVAIVWLVSALPCPASRADTSDKIDFNRDIRPILSNACLKCHGPDPKGRQGGGQDGLRLDAEESALADLGGYAAIVRGKPDDSELIRRITSEDADLLMPPKASGKQLSTHEIALLKKWIEQGAAFARHWSYVKPVRPPVPEIQDRAWPRNAIDAFLLARLEREGLRPSPEADRYALIRRVTLDITGLPPTAEEVDQFLADARPDAYDQLVDRLLASEAYGEHWARMWLDLARYADSAGYADDPPRTIWLFRDYVIRALNANKPFDQFTIEQIAGDLLPNPTEDQLTATAFHRNTLTNNEGGTNDEEFRNVAVVDRVNTTMAVWMGTTMACAQCHSHKYDPLTQEEYFRFFALLNNSEDADRGDESPLLTIWSDEQKRQKADWQAEIEQLEQTLRMPTPELLAAQSQWEQTFAGDLDSQLLAILKTPAGQRSDAQQAELTRHFLSVAEELKPSRERLAAVKKQLAEMKPAATVPILRELPAERKRKTNVQYRGNFLDPGPEVEPGVPAALHPLPAGASADRLGLARWLVDDNNPLTARVVVNRYWEQLFGIGIVRTSEEFGSQGELPTHPELLDWLATELVQEEWDLKYLVKLLVTSAAYRQTSRVTPELQDRDPDNVLLARGPRFRLTSEVIRDQALAVSGLLSRKMYGPPVKPPQPSLGLSAAFGSGIDWKTSEGEDRYRRALYTTWRRSSPYPSLAAFDAPNREVCTLRRDRSNTPLQALVTLNDPVYIEAAQSLARRMAAAEGAADDKVRFGFRSCVARPPSDAELARLVKLYEAARQRFGQAQDQGRQFATDPLGPPPDGAEISGLAAWTMVGNVLLNLDEMLMRK